MICKRVGEAVAIALAVMLVAAACAAGPNDVSNAGVHVAGFWRGLWHGMLYPITFVISLFTQRVSLYEVHNNGGWYDFGFVLGIAVLHAIVRPSNARRVRDRNRGRSQDASD